VSEKWSVDLEGVKPPRSGSECQAEIELRRLIAIGKELNVDLKL